MTDLIHILYEYACKHRMRSYLDSEPQYRESGQMSGRQYRELQELLNEEGRQHLEDYRGEVKLMHDIELEAIFCAGLSLGQELSRS